MTGLYNKTRWPALLGGLLAMVACGGGSVQTAGIEGTGDTVSATGSITAFGSIYVNGERFTTDDAGIRMNGELVQESALTAGMVVEVEGTASADVPAAEQVVYDRLIRGPIAAVETLDSVRKQLRVLGQSIIVTEDATFAGAEFDSLAAGTVISVSGFPGVDATLATYVAVEDLPADSVWDLEGEITGVDIARSRFALNDLSVDFSQAVFEQGDRQDLVSGAKVEVHGRLSPAGVFDATRVVYEDAAEVADGVEASVEGIVTAYTSAAEFIVNRLTVDASSAQLERGAPSDLRQGSRVSVTGRMTSDSLLVAEKVQLVLPNSERIEGTIDRIDTASQSITVLGRQYHTDDMTIYQDRSTRGNRFVRLDTLHPGDSVKVFARAQGDLLLATRVVRTDSQAEQTLKGPISEIEGLTIYVMGVAVDLSEANVLDLIASLTPGTQVTVTGSITGNASMTASAIKVHQQPSCHAPVAVVCGEGDDDRSGDQGQSGEDDEPGVDIGAGDRADSDSEAAGDVASKRLPVRL